MKLDNGGGWVAGQSGQDPNGTDDVTGVKTARDLPNPDDYQQETIDFLKAQQNIHRSAIAEIQKYLDNVAKGKVNKNGPSEAPRYTPDNAISSKPGPRGDKFSITSRQHLEYLQRQRQIAEQELATQKAILAERKKELAARMALAEVQKETVFSS